MRTPATPGSKGCRSDCRRKHHGNFAFLSGTRPKPRHGRIAPVILITISLSIEESIHSPKQDFAFQRRPPSVLHLACFVARDQELAGPARSEKIDSHKNWSDHHRMHTIYPDRVYGMDVR